MGLNRFVFFIALLLVAFSLSAFDAEEDVVVLNQDPVALDIAIGLDLMTVGMVPSTGLSLYVSGDWAATEFMNITFVEHFFNPGGFLLMIDRDDRIGEDYTYVPDYMLCSTLKAGVEIPFSTWEKRKAQVGFVSTGSSYLTRRRHRIANPVPYEKAFAFRTGYVHSIGGPGLLTQAQFEYSGYDYQVNYNKNWHGIYGGLSYYSKGAQLLQWEDNGEMKQERQGLIVRHSLDLHYYFITDMLTLEEPFTRSSMPPLDGPFTEIDIPIAIEYTFGWRVYGSMDWWPWGDDNVLGTLFMDTTIGYGPFFKAPEGITYKDENSVFPLYVTFALGFPIGM